MYDTQMTIVQPTTNSSTPSAHVGAQVEQKPTVEQRSQARETDVAVIRVFLQTSPIEDNAASRGDVRAIRRGSLGFGDGLDHALQVLIAHRSVESPVRPLCQNLVSHLHSLPTRDTACDGKVRELRHEEVSRASSASA